MRPLDIIRQKRRFMMFSDKTKFSVLEVNSFFGKYVMQHEDTLKKTFIYYDTPDRDLEKSNIVLFKTHVGKLCELNMMTEKLRETQRYTVRDNNKHFTLSVRVHESIFKHKDWLINSFKNMFMSSLNFDPEFLLKKLQIAYVIETKSEEYRSVNATGLKITYSFDTDKFTNNFDHIETRENVLTIYQHSATNTDEEFEDLIGKLSRYCKELTPTDDTKIQIARKSTAPKQVITNAMTFIDDKKSKKTNNKKKKK